MKVVEKKPETLPMLTHFLGMEENSSRIIFTKIKADVSSFDTAQDSSKSSVKIENFSRNQNAKLPKPITSVEREMTAKGRIIESRETAEERQRNGRYLAIGATLIMLFIAFYHTLLRHATVLAGLLAPAIIMLLYILWLFYFARKKKPQVSAV